MTAWDPSSAAIDVSAGTVAVASSLSGDAIGAAITASGRGHVDSTANTMSGDTAHGAVASRGVVR